MRLRGDAYPCFGWGCDIAEVEVGQRFELVNERIENEHPDKERRKP